MPGQTIKKFAVIIALSTFIFTNLLQNVTAFAVEEIPYNNLKDSVMVGNGNLFEGANNLLPGDLILKNVTLQNKSNSDLAFYLIAKPIKDDIDAEKISKELISLIKLKLELAEPEGAVKVIYSGSFSGKPVNGNEENTITPIFVGKLNAQKNGVVNATITVPGELNNRFQKVVGKIDWQFYCEEYSDNDSDKDSSDDDEENQNVGEEEQNNTETGIDSKSEESIDPNKTSATEITGSEVPLIDNTVEIDTFQPQTDNQKVILPLNQKNEIHNVPIENVTANTKVEGLSIVIDDKKMRKIQKTESGPQETLLEPTTIGTFSIAFLGIPMVFFWKRFLILLGKRILNIFK